MLALTLALTLARMLQRGSGVAVTERPAAAGKSRTKGHRLRRSQHHSEQR